MGIPFREIASKISARLKIPTASVPDAKSARHLRFLADFIALDNPSSSEWTRQALGWKPDQVRLLADLEHLSISKADSFVKNSSITGSAPASRSGLCSLP
jgi:hypothetical protein